MDGTEIVEVQASSGVDCSTLQEGIYFCYPDGSLVPASTESGHVSEETAICITIPEPQALEAEAVMSDEPPSLEQQVLNHEELQDHEHNLNQDCPVVIDSEEAYCALLLQYLSTKTFPAHINKVQRQRIIGQSRYYRVQDGQLFYGHKGPRRVLFDEQEKSLLMMKSHIIPESGIHIGAWRMFNELKTGYFWKGMYMELKGYVRDCPRCTDETLANAKTEKKKKEQPKKENTEKNSTDGMSYPSNKSPAWQKVELRLHGPFLSSYYILTLADTYSQWVEAKLVPIEEDITENTQQFIASCFLQLGFAPFSMVGFLPDIQNSVISHLREIYDEVYAQITDNDSASEQLFEKDENILCPWVSVMLSNLMKAHLYDWPEQLTRYIFKVRNIPFRKVPGFFVTPFLLMFQRFPLSTMEEVGFPQMSGSAEMSEFTSMDVAPGTELASVDVSPGTEFASVDVSPAAPLQVNSGDPWPPEEEFISPPEESSYPSEAVLGEETEPCAETRLDTETEVDEDVEMSEDTTPTDNAVSHSLAVSRAETVAAVQAELAATEEERRRQGRNYRYTPEQRIEIAKFAIEYGIQAAVDHFSELYRARVNLNTIKSMVRLFKNFTPEMQDKIGCCAMFNSVQDTANDFKKKLDCDIPFSAVKTFKKMFAAKNGIESAYVDSSDPVLCVTRSEPHKIMIHASMKDEIGEYASVNGVAAAVEHFQQKLLVPVRENVVQLLKEVWEEVHCSTSGDRQAEATCGADWQGAKRWKIGESAATSDPDTRRQTRSMTTAQLKESVLSETPLEPAMPTHLEQTAAPSSLQQLAVPTPLEQPLTPTPLEQLSTPTPVPTLSSPTTLEQPLTPTCMDQSSTCQQEQDETSEALFTPISYSPSLLAAHQLLAMSEQLITHQPNIQTQTSLELRNNLADVVPHSPVALVESTGVNIAIPKQVYQDVTQKEIVTTDFSVLFQSSNELVATSEVIHQKVSTSKSSIKDSKKKNASTVKGREKNRNKLKKCTTSVNKKQKSKKKKEPDSNKQRSSYNTRKYGSPEQRAEIGCFAAEHGMHKTIAHFHKILGYLMPVSTVRSLKNQYVAKQAANKEQGESEEVTTLGFAPRGCPVNLGQYDHLIRDCIKDLMAHGQKLTPYMAIIIAKKVLTRHNPSLLMENGGNVNLNVNWAKSFLKRMGISNK